MNDNYIYIKIFFWINLFKLHSYSCVFLLKVQWRLEIILWEITRKQFSIPWNLNHHLPEIKKQASLTQDCSQCKTAFLMIIVIKSIRKRHVQKEKNIGSPPDSFWVFQMIISTKFRLKPTSIMIKLAKKVTDLRIGSSFYWSYTCLLTVKL